MRPLQFPLAAREAFSFAASLIWVVKFTLALFALGVSAWWVIDLVTTFTPSGVAFARAQIQQIPRHLRNAAGW